MKANTVRVFAQGLLFAASIVALAPSAAMAQGDVVGKFTLPVEVHWGDVVLTPGSYSILADNRTTTSTMCVYKQGSPLVGYFIPAVERETIPASVEKTQLILGEKDGTVYVKELQLGGEGLALHYTAPKSKKSDRL